MSHADTLDTALRLLGRARYALDDLTGRTSSLPEPILQSAEKLADDIARFIGHTVTDTPEDPQLHALRDYLGDVTDVDPVHELAAHIEAAVLGGPRCDPTMVHYFGPRDAPVAGLFDANGHPQNCPAHAKPVDASTPKVSESSESATRTTTPGRRHGVPYACDGCGARPDQGVMCLAPDRKHTWRPLPAETSDAAPRTVTIRQPCNAPAPLVVNGGTFAGCEHTDDHDRHQLTVTWERT